MLKPEPTIVDYDEIGSTYTLTRQADGRIGLSLIQQLNLPKGSHLVDIGAGTGNYSEFLALAGFSVSAVEPSQTMRAQGKQHPHLDWVEGVGEALPFSDGQFDGAVMTLSLHHVKNWQTCISEALRVTKGGPLIIFAFDPQHEPDFWLFDYFPTLAKLDASFVPTFEKLNSFVQGIGCSFELSKYLLPKDLCDNFAAAGWARPHIYLDQKFQKGISTFSKIPKQELVDGNESLTNDLLNGTWIRKYGLLLDNEFHDRGYVFIRIAA